MTAANSPAERSPERPEVATPSRLRHLILCADDYGLAPGVNAGIRELVAGGRLNAVSAMVVGDNLDTEAAATLLATAKGGHAEIGLHLTLTAPFRPLTGRYRPTRGGAFLTLPQTFARAMLRRLDRVALAAEISAQIARFAEVFGRPPAYVDGHQHVHLLPQVREALIAAARAQAPGAWLRQCGTATGLRGGARDPKGAVIDGLSRRFRRLATRHGLATNPAFAGTYSFRADADFAALFPRFLDGLPDRGLVMCHPGRVDAELCRLDPLTTLRERELAYLGGPEFPRVLAASGWTLHPPGAPS